MGIKLKDKNKKSHAVGTSNVLNLKATKKTKDSDMTPEQFEKIFHNVAMNVLDFENNRQASGIKQDVAVDSLVCFQGKKNMLKIKKADLSSANQDGELAEISPFPSGRGSGSKKGD